MDYLVLMIFCSFYTEYFTKTFHEIKGIAILLTVIKMTFFSLFITGSYKIVSHNLDYVYF